MTPPLPPRFTFQFAWDPAAFRRANRLVIRHAKYAPWLGVFLKAFPWVAGSVLLLWLGLIVSRQNWNALAASAPWLLIIALWFAFLSYGTAWLGVRSWEKRHPIGHREIGVELSEHGFLTRSYPGELQLRWEAIVQVVEVQDFFLFYLAPQAAHYLPKASIPSEELPEVRSLLAAAKGRDFITR